MSGETNLTPELNALRADFSDRINRIYMILIYPVDPAFICEIESNLGIDDTCRKGVSIEQAKASALMEAIERYSCEWFIKEKEPFIISSYDNLIVRSLLSKKSARGQEGKK